VIEPTKIYVKPVLAALKAHKGAIHGMAHITGGGLTENIPRVLSDDLAAHLDAKTWDFQAIFRWLLQLGKIEPDDMARTLNCGIGLVIIVDEAQAEAVKKTLTGAGEKVSVIGKITKRKTDAVVIDNLDTWR
jgi:phosphoribosylaminoimidazole (AIR) synthetase